MSIDIIVPSPAAAALLASVMGGHVKPLLEAAAAERCGLGLLDQGSAPFDLPRLTVPLVTIIGDDPVQGSLGPEGFHALSVERLLLAAFHVSIVACEPLPRIYRDAANVAWSGRSAVVIETRPEHVNAWVTFVTSKASGRLKMVANVRTEGAVR